MNRKRYISFFLLMAMSLVVLPAPLEAACDMTAHPDIDPCESCLADFCDDLDCEPETDHGDDCCDTGCQHCSLPCCAGTAMISAASPATIFQVPADGRLAVSAPQAPWVDADPLYHPPRA